jgi:hypothetical protein
MSTVPERPPGANDTPPSKSTSTDLPRWAELGLADPPPDARMPEQGQTADLLAFALVLPGADCPITGIIDAVQVELRALAGMLEATGAGDLLLMLSNRLAVASLLLRRVDGRAPEPPDWDPDNDVTRDAAPEASEPGDA